MEVAHFFLRWIHFLAGITWIGLLYYFNFVQTPFFAETEAPVRTGAIQKLVPRALWWFRWGAMITFLAGILMYLMRLGEMGGGLFFTSSYGVTITLGGLMGTIMFLNVWLVIWPNQQIVIDHPGSAGRPSSARGSWGRSPRRADVENQHRVLDPDAVFHGSGEPLHFFSGPIGLPSCVLDSFLDHYGRCRVQRARRDAGTDKKAA
jgi:uncharacterized membrane protein